MASGSPFLRTMCFPPKAVNMHNSRQGRSVMAAVAFEDGKYENGMIAFFSIKIEWLHSLFSKKICKFAV